VVQREILKENEALKQLPLSQATAARVIHGEDGEAVWEIQLDNALSILKLAREGPQAEVAGTLIAGLLGISVAQIALRTLTEADIESLKKVAATDEDSQGALAYLKVDGVALLMEKFSGTDLDKLVENKQDITEQPDFEPGQFMRQLGQMAAVDLIVGIGDRFKLPGYETVNVNMGNIILDKGNLHGIDYDVEQGLWEHVKKGEEADDTQYFKDEAARAFANPDKIVELVENTVKTAWPKLVEEGNHVEPIKAGIQDVVDKLKTLDQEQLQQLEQEANDKLAGYGSHVTKLISMIQNGENPEDPFDDMGF
jgi:hypothetical protein